MFFLIVPISTGLISYEFVRNYPLHRGRGEWHNAASLEQRKPPEMADNSIQTRGFPSRAGGQLPVNGEISQISQTSLRMVREKS